MDINTILVESTKYPDIVLNIRQLCDLELLLNGGFAPLKGFLRQNDYNSVVENMRLTDGNIWPMPIVLPIEKNDDEINNLLTKSQHITLKDNQGFPIAIMDNFEIWKPNLQKECQNVYGTNDDNHPYVSMIYSMARSAEINGKNIYYIGGELRKIQLPKHFDFEDLRKTPEEVKQLFSQKGWGQYSNSNQTNNVNIVGFQTRNPMHRSHFELTKYALREAGNNSKLLLHPVVGITQDCDVNYHLRVRCYKKLMNAYGNDAVLSLLPLSMRMAGPREALWHALIRKNYGCTHFIVGRDHAGPSYKTKDGKDFYGPYDAHQLLLKHKDEIGINIILAQMIVYVKELNGYLPINKVNEINNAIDEGRGGDCHNHNHNEDGRLTVLNISGTEQRRLLSTGQDIPEWFTFPEIANELKREFKKINERGLCLYFVGLSGSGKSTLANALHSKLLELEVNRGISILDGDIVRQHLSKGLGFSREDRSINVQRIGYVASEIVKHGGVVLCANIAPYENDRTVNRNLIQANGNYVEIYVNTTIDVCESRDAKGLYQLAKKGIIKQFTGISDPFEEPKKPEININGADSLENNMNTIIQYLNTNGLL